MTITPCPCGMKPLALCVCEDAPRVDNKIALVILQHPQEQDRTLGSAPLAVKVLTHAQLKIGLSWPSLSKMLGREAQANRWGVLYLGSLSADKIAPGRDVVLVNKKGEAAADQSPLRDLEGVIVLDGTWSQAKALWWRNAWMLKCRRIILNPKTPSRYGALRKEPRKDSLSTIEAAGLLLARLEKRPEIEAATNAAFDAMLKLFREIKRTNPEITRR